LSNFRIDDSLPYIKWHVVFILIKKPQQSHIVKTKYLPLQGVEWKDFYFWNTHVRDAFLVNMNKL
jgi:hypothetical protein